jgi:predicted RNase H-like HicB family nuclease
VTNRPNYRARARRGERSWVIAVPEVDGAFIQAKRIDQPEAMAREVIALPSVRPDFL